MRPAAASAGRHASHGSAGAARAKHAGPRTLEPRAGVAYAEAPWARSYAATRLTGPRGIQAVRCSPCGPAAGGSRSRRLQFADRVSSVAAGLIAAGIAAGDRVGLMAGASLDWLVCDFAIWAAGAVTVPVYETSSAAQVRWILGDSGAVAAFAGSARLAGTIGNAAAAEAGNRLADGRRRPRRARPGRTGSYDRRDSGRAADGRGQPQARRADPGDAGHHRLHLGQHRPAEGLHDQSRQPGRGGPRHHRHPRAAASGY